ncbi:KxYKxGKxW signal peptide domain-containing protein [Peptococcus niger]
MRKKGKRLVTAGLLVKTF